MKLPIPRISVRRMMVIVFLVAVDFAIVRSMRDANQDLGIVFVALPMANLLVLIAPRVWSGDASRAFWIGFEIAGWCSVGVF